MTACALESAGPFWRAFYGQLYFRVEARLRKAQVPFLRALSRAVLVSLLHVEQRPARTTAWQCLASFAEVSPKPRCFSLSKCSTRSASWLQRFSPSVPEVVSGCNNKMPHKRATVNSKGWLSDGFGDAASHFDLLVASESRRVDGMPRGYAGVFLVSPTVDGVVSALFQI